MNSPRSKIQAVLAILTALVMLAGCAAADTAIRTVTAGIVGGTSDLDGVWHVTRNEDAKLQIRWAATEVDASFTILITLPDKQQISEIVTGTVFLYPEKDLPAGQYEMAIRAYTADGTQSGYGLMKFVLEESGAEQPQEEQQEQQEQPADRQDGNEPSDGQNPDAPGEGGGNKGGGKGSPPTGGNKGGGMPSGGGAGKKSQGASVTAGKALTSYHASGNGSLLPYGTVELTIGDEPMEILTLGGEELELDCGGYPFTGEIREDVLVLTSEGGEDAWAVTQRTLKTLNESGIREIRLVGEEETALETGMEFTGSLYAGERAQGYVSSDFLLFRQDGEWSVAVEDRVYSLSELTADEENGR